MVAASAQLGLGEHRVAAILIEPDRPERDRRGLTPRLAVQHEARQIVERIEIEQERDGAVERGRLPGR
jgi:hypothetical protein